MTMPKAVFLALAGWIIVACTDNTPKAGVVEPYRPKRKITFPHDIHTRVNGIDCKYCHNSPVENKQADLPLPDNKICLNCHKAITGS